VVINSSQNDLAVDWPTSGQCIISLVNDATGALPPAGDRAQAMVKFSAADYDATWQWRPSPIAVWIDGAPTANRQVRLAITEFIRFFPNFSGSVAYADVAPAIDVVIAIRRIVVGTTYTLGSIKFAAGSGVGYWTSTGGFQQHLLAGD